MSSMSAYAMTALYYGVTKIKSSRTYSYAVALMQYTAQLLTLVLIAGQPV